MVHVFFLKETASLQSQFGLLVKALEFDMSLSEYSILWRINGVLLMDTMMKPQTIFHATAHQLCHMSRKSVEDSATRLYSQDFGWSDYWDWTSLLSNTGPMNALTIKTRDAQVRPTSSKNMQQYLPKDKNYMSNFCSMRPFTRSFKTQRTGPGGRQTIPQSHFAVSAQGALLVVAWSWLRTCGDSQRPWTAMSSTPFLSKSGNKERIFDIWL